MSDTLNNAYEAGCDAALETAIQELEDVGLEKIANVVMDKLKSGAGKVKNFYSYSAAKGRQLERMGKNPKTVEKYNKVMGEKGHEAAEKLLRRNVALRAGGEVAAKGAATAGALGGAGYGAYRATQDK